MFNRKQEEVKEEVAEEVVLEPTEEVAEPVEEVQEVTKEPELNENGLVPGQRVTFEQIQQLNKKKKPVEKTVSVDDVKKLIADK